MTRFVQSRGDLREAHPFLSHFLDLGDDRGIGGVHTSRSGRDRGFRRCIPGLGRSPCLRLGTLSSCSELRTLLLRRGHPILDEVSACVPHALGLGQVQLECPRVEVLVVQGDELQIRPTSARARRNFRFLTNIRILLMSEQWFPPFSFWAFTKRLVKLFETWSRVSSNSAIDLLFAITLVSCRNPGRSPSLQMIGRLRLAHRRTWSIDDELVHGCASK